MNKHQDGDLRDEFKEMVITVSRIYDLLDKLKPNQVASTSSQGKSQDKMPDQVEPWPTGAQEVGTGHEDQELTQFLHLEGHGPSMGEWRKHWGDIHPSTLQE